MSTIRKNKPREGPEYSIKEKVQRELPLPLSEAALLGHSTLFSDEQEQIILCSVNSDFYGLSNSRLRKLGLRQETGEMNI